MTSFETNHSFGSYVQSICSNGNNQPKQPERGDWAATTAENPSERNESYLEALKNHPKYLQPCSTRSIYCQLPSLCSQERMFSLHLLSTSTKPLTRPSTYTKNRPPKKRKSTRPASLHFYILVLQLEYWLQSSTSLRLVPLVAPPPTKSKGKVSIPTQHCSHSPFPLSSNFILKSPFVLQKEGRVASRWEG